MYHAYPGAFLSIKRLSSSSKLRLLRVSCCLDRDEFNLCFTCNDRNLILLWRLTPAGSLSISAGLNLSTEKGDASKNPLTVLLKLDGTELVGEVVDAKLLINPGQNSILVQGKWASLVQDATIDLEASLFEFILLESPDLFLRKLRWVTSSSGAGALAKGDKALAGGASVVLVGSSVRVVIAG